MREFYIESDGIRLHAKLDMPYDMPESGKCPLALVIHGLTGHMEETHIKAVSAVFNKLGIATLRTEMYGHGKSGGNFEDHSIIRWLVNVTSVMRYIRGLDFVTDLYIAGHSQGGLTALLAAGMYPEIFSAAVLLSPASMMPEQARAGDMFGVSFDPCSVPDEIYVSPTEKVNGDYLRAAQLVSIETQVGRYKKPVLIVHGEKDEAVPLRYSEKLAEDYYDAKLVVIPGDDHCYNMHLNQVTGAVRDFFRDRLHYEV